MIFKRHHFFILLFNLTTKLQAQVYNIRSSNAWRASFYVSVGEPPQKMLAYLNFASPDTMVIDSECGQRTAKGCKRYCSNEVFRRHFCQIHCMDLTEASRSLVCSDFTKYESKNSTTFVPDVQMWKGEFTGMRLMEGQYAKDTFILMNYDHSRRKLKSVLETKQFRFVRGFSMDVRLFRSNSVLIGVGPSTNQSTNLLDHLYKSKQIAIPTACFWNMGVGVQQINSGQQNILTLGAVEKRHCGPWARRPNLSKTGWVFQMDIDIGGVRFKSSENKITFHYKDNFYILAPRSALQQLLKAGIIVQFEKYPDSYYFPQNYTTTMSFYADGIQITHPRILDFFKGYGTYTESYLKLNDMLEYQDSPTWILNEYFFKYACVLMDYERNELGLAKSILWPNGI